MCHMAVQVKAPAAAAADAGINMAQRILKTVGRLDLDNLGKGPALTAQHGKDRRPAWRS